MVFKGKQSRTPAHLGILCSHPIQYYAPLFRVLAKRIQIKVYYAHRATPADQASAGFGVEFEWDTDLLHGYESVFLQNRAKSPDVNNFSGCDTPEIWRYLRQGNHTAMLVTGWYLKSFIQGILAAKLLGLPVLARGDSHMHTPRGGLKRAAKRLLYPAFLRCFDRGLYVGERSRDYWKSYGYPEGRLFFSPHSVDSKWFQRRSSSNERHSKRADLNIEANENVLLFVGKLIHLKRPQDLIAAAAQLRTRGIHTTVLIAGAGSLERELVLYARQSGVKVHLLGFCNQSEMPNIYAAADVLVIPSSNETWGLVANEALACGKPIIVSTGVGCAPDLASDGEVGRTFPVGDIRRLADCIAAAIANPPPRGLIQAQSDRYSLEATVEGIMEALESIENDRTPS